MGVIVGAKGLRGEVRIKSFTENPRGVELRYKLVQNAVESPAPTPVPAAAQNLSFGLVMERTLVDSKSSFENEAERTNAMMMIDFDTGSLLSGPQAMWDADTDAQKRWMQANGVDALCVVLGVGGLVGLDMKTLSVPPPTWDEVSMTMLNQLVGSPRQETVSLTLPLPTAYALQNAKEAAAPTWLFQTREGAMGVLQITGFTDNPRGVKIRYKLVQNPSLNL